MIVEIQVVPDPSGDPDQPYGHVDAAIAVITSSGLAYEVGALGTTIEGPAERIWPLLQAVHEACLTSGARRVLTYVKLADWADEDAAPTAVDLTAKHRDHP